MSTPGKHPDLTLGRIEAFLKHKHLLPSKLYSEKQSESVSLKCWAAPGRITFQEAVSHIAEFKDVKDGQEFGPPWSTHWFFIKLEIPQEWEGKEVHFLFDCGSAESLVWSEAGVPLCAMNGSTGDDRRANFILEKEAKPGSRSFWLELACNGLFGNSQWEVGPTQPDPNIKFNLKEAQIAVRDTLAYGLFWDLQVIGDIARHSNKEYTPRNSAMWIANKMINTIDLEDRSTWEAARHIAKEYLSSSGGPFVLHAVGHAHIDTAWLWPYAETRRKCGRSWITQLRLMEQHPWYRFVCSQAQQHAWVQQDYPEIFAQLQQAAARGQFIPVGGTWVEMDCNIPSGESLVRQFFYGQQFFKRAYGEYCREFWLPDTFGYAAQLPQIMKGAGIEYFLTQKLSWNQINKPPNSTFIWEGIDGSQVLVHFPPADTYNSAANVKELIFSETNFKDKDRSNDAMLVFGHGDGGGGPTPNQLEMLDRAHADGLPTIKFTKPSDFFDIIVKRKADYCRWVGELYFEYHRGTYTTQAKNKLFNRRSEELLRSIELACTWNAVQAAAAYPREKIDELWKLVLLNQFHDVIPGSSIAQVYVDSAEHYAYIMEQGHKLLADAFHGEGNAEFFNSLAQSRLEIVNVNGHLHIAEAQSFASAKVLPVDALASLNLKPVHLHREGDSFVIENSFVRATLNHGRLTSLVHLATGNEAISGVANQFVIFDDNPLYWDAWDVDAFHLEKRSNVTECTQGRVEEESPLRVSISFDWRISKNSTIAMIARLSATSDVLEFECKVDWHEQHKFLKVEFPLAIRSSTATYEIPYGLIERPTHYNTSWDLAKFEVCAHRFADLSETGFGVSILNDSKYGYSAFDNWIRLSLLRGPTNPDPNADQGEHRFRYGVVCHQGDLHSNRMVQKALAFNVPLVQHHATLRRESFLSVTQNGKETANVVIDAVKLAESGNAVVVRVYEAYGSRGSFEINAFKQIAAVFECNLLEEGDVAVATQTATSFHFKILPFQVRTFKIVFQPK